MTMLAHVLKFRKPIAVTAGAAAIAVGVVFSLVDVRYLWNSLVIHRSSLKRFPAAKNDKKKPFSPIGKHGDKELQANQERALELLSGDKWHIHNTYVGVFDIDYFLHMNNAKYLIATDHARGSMLDECGIWAATFALRTPGLMVNSAARFRRELALFQKYTIASRLVGYDDKSMMFEHRFYAKAKGASTMTLHTLIFTRLQIARGSPQALFEWLGLDKVLPKTREPPPDVAHWLMSSINASARSSQDTIDSLQLASPTAMATEPK